jgi:hypothetical protein
MGLLLDIRIIWVFLSGLYTSLWGAFKDCPYEGFKPKTFPRSIWFSIAIWFFYEMLLPYFGFEVPGLSLINTFQLFFFVMGVERFVAELYKGFFRTEDQSKYFIPSRVTLLGRPVHSELLRRAAGVVLVSSTLLVAFLPWKMETYWQFLIVAYSTGLLVSLGGAYKDAPFEGFMPLKFQRSAVVLAVASPLFYFLGPVSLGVLIFMNGGLERFLVEYYKTYIKRNMSGKFRPDLKIHEDQKATREKFHLLAWVIIVALGLLYARSL